MTPGRRCAACKYLRRKCPLNCIFSPYFPSNDPQRFACVHRIYGAKNVAKMLQDLPTNCRGQAVDTMYIEAQHRIEDPVYGCVRIISQLHQQIQHLETQLAKTRAEIAIISSNPIQDQAQHDTIEDHSLDSDLNHNLVIQITSNNIEQSHAEPSNQPPWI